MDLANHGRRHKQDRSSHRGRDKSPHYHSDKSPHYHSDKSPTRHTEQSEIKQMNIVAANNEEVLDRINGIEDRLERLEQTTQMSLYNIEALLRNFIFYQSGRQGSRSGSRGAGSGDGGAASYALDYRQGFNDGRPL